MENKKYDVKLSEIVALAEKKYYKDYNQDVHPDYNQKVINLPLNKKILIDILPEQKDLHSAKGLAELSVTLSVTQDGFSDYYASGDELEPISKNWAIGMIINN